MEYFQALHSASEFTRFLAVISWFAVIRYIANSVTAALIY